MIYIFSEVAYCILSMVFNRILLQKYYCVYIDSQPHGGDLVTHVGGTDIPYIVYCSITTL